MYIAMSCSVDSYFGGGFFFATDTPYLAFGSLYFCGTENVHIICEGKTKQKRNKVSIHKVIIIHV